MKTIQEELAVLKGDLSGLHIMVIGDVMIDRYIRGTASRISPEAPVPVVVWKHSEDVLGGASNVIANLKSMGCRTSLMGICGEDSDGDILDRLLRDIGCDRLHLIRDPERPSTVKTRIIADHHQIVRIDHESDRDISTAIQKKCLDLLESVFSSEKPDVLILQDYNKGLLHGGWIGQIIQMARAHDIKIAVDPKKSHFFEYREVHLFKPNLKEALQATDWPAQRSDDLMELSKSIKNRLLCETVMITLASEGIWIDSPREQKRYPTQSRKVSDVSGAGDTVISLAAICLALSLSDKFMAVCCNAGGGQVCERSGVVPVQKTALIRELED